jgi:peptidyl-tRNA hydrolase, PTH1 family
MLLLVGLGNPGEKYNLSRHNVGFLTVDKLKEFHKLGNWKFEKKFNAEIIKGEINGEKTIIAKPQTFMNNSGCSVKLLTTFYKIDPEDVTVIHDDIDIDLGKRKTQQGRGPAGHNGVKSIIHELGTNNFSRIRVGIKNEKTQGQIPTEKYVLEKFTKEEIKSIEKTIQEII